jgi:hypothetical protein
MLRILLIMLIFSIAFPALCHAERPIIDAVEVQEQPTIDGDISDACWQQAPSVTDYYLTSDSSKSTEETKTWVCYDQKNIYLAWYCKDSQPDKIMAQQKKRGGSIGFDDWVGVDLDCYGDCSRIVWFDVSAGGVQKESLESGAVSKIEWRGDWYAATKRLSDGYTVEIAIPFSILHYNSAQDSMGIAFLRKHARTERVWWSPNVGANNDKKLFYVWKGLRLPKYTAKPLLLAYSLFGAGGDDEQLAKTGLDAKYAPTPNLLGAITVNPDFRSIEQDVTRVDFSYKEAYRSDARPFFQEGSGYFPGSDIFYSRRIEDIDYGAKALGRLGPYDFGVMNAGTFERESYTVGKLSRSWQNRASAIFSWAMSERPGIHNFAWETYGDYRLHERKGHLIDFSASIQQADAASGSGTGMKQFYMLASDGPPRTLIWNITREIVDPNFDPLIGYMPEKDLQRWLTSIYLYDEPSGGSLSSWWSQIYSNKADHSDGSTYYHSLCFENSFSFRNGMGLGTTILSRDRPPYHDLHNVLSLSWGENDLYKNGGISVDVGKLVGGSHLDCSIYQGWNIGDRFSLSGSYEYSHIRPPSPEAYSSQQVVGTFSYDLDTQRTVASRIVSRKGRTNLYLAFRQRVRAGMDAYLLLGDPNAETTKSSLTLKLISPL